MKPFLSLFLVLVVCLSTLVGCGEKNTSSSVGQASSVVDTSSNKVERNDSEEETSASSVVSSSAEVSSSVASSSSEASSSAASSSSKPKESSSKTESTSSKPKKETSNSSSQTVVSAAKNKLFPGYKYNTKLNIEDNVFLDALEYTGYNLKKHRKDGLMWTYILSGDKAHRNWLSDITYGGGSTGLETTKKGLPNIEKFEKGGLVCASFASYVYFNYLPNVAKIDTSSLAVPEKTYSAQSFYEACKKWLKKGYTYNIGFTAKNTASGISFKSDEEIPLGSIIVFRDFDKPQKKEADHITIYVGKKNGYHWVIQTGNKNGPEFCAVERFKFGPDPQWPLAIFATPNCIYDEIAKDS